MNLRPRRAALATLLATSLAATLTAGVGATPGHAAGPATSVFEKVNASAWSSSASDAATVALQDRLHGALQRMVDTVLGPGTAVVTVTAELDFTEIETVSRTYTQDPSAGALAERLSSRSYLDTNGTRYQSSSTDRINALNSVAQARHNTPGTVKRLNIAVLVDAAAGSTIDLPRLRELVSVAAGVDLARGDAVAVAALPFNIDTATPADNTVTTSQNMASLDRWAVLFATALALLIIVVMLTTWRRSRRHAARRADLEELHRVRVTVREQHAITAGTRTAAPAPDRKGIGRQHAIGRLAGGNPERTAAALRGWTGAGR